MDIDEEITRLKTQYSHAKKKENHVYDKALEFHEKMIRKKLPPTEKNIIIHDRAMVVIRRWQRSNLVFVD